MAGNSGDAGRSDGDSDPLSRESMFDLLSNRRRRILLTCLNEHGPTIALPDLAEEVAVREFDSRVTEIPEERVLHVYTSLYHVHVPKLVDAGVVEYEQERDLVRVTENARLVESFGSRFER